MPPLRLRAAMVAALLPLGLALAGARGLAWGQQPPAKKKAAPVVPGPPPLAGEKLRGPKGFAVQLVYAVPRESQGSWVNLAVDPKGRLIASDQYGKLYRVTVPPIGANAPTPTPTIEPIDVAIGEAQGLLWAFDSLYVVVNTGGKFPSGLYRVRDTDGDDKLDKVDLLKKLEGSGEHGPHAVVLAPDGKSLYVIAGNATKVPPLAGSLVPRAWGEDHLLPRMVDGRGFMTDEKAPGGYICRVDPEGKDWTLQSMGYRNPFDMAFHRDGDLFTYDSDMEWDMNTPWYRPTRVCFASPGGDFGYRNGAGKQPTYYPDSLPPTYNVGPGSPTGVTFGYGAKFPAKYQDALFIADWSYGKLYAVHLQPDGAGYRADAEEFVTGAPLPLTDMVVNPGDGALYFAVGGRRTTSALYRVVYTGAEPTAPSTATLAGAETRALRRSLEAFQGHADPAAVAAAWPHLDHPDRFIRFAARVAIETQPVDQWRDKALNEARPLAAIEALLALARVGATDPAHRAPGAAPPDAHLGRQIIDALNGLDLAKLPYAQRLDALRAYAVTLHRFGMANPGDAKALEARFAPLYPARGRELNVELANLLVYLNSPTVAAKTVPLLESAPTQEEQIEYARALRTLAVGWTPELRRAYFGWINRAGGLKGGASFGGFVKQIRDAAVATLTDAEKADLKAVLDAPSPATPADVAATVARANAAHPRAFVRSWTLDELGPGIEAGLKQHRDFDRGRSLFAAANCFACHRYDNEGGAVGPDLTAVAGRFSPRDLLESILLPSKTISDQYEAIIVATDDGKVVTGRVVNLNGDSMMINTDMLNPNAQVTINRNKIEETRPSPISMMPEGLLSTLTQDEVADLMAYLLSRGNRDLPMFR